MLVNLVSRSLVMLRGKPCYDTTALKINSAMLSAVAGSSVGRNFAILLNLSMTTKMPVFPADVFGRSVRKSIAMSFQGPSGIGNGCRSPPGFYEEILLRWHMSQLAMCLVTASLSLGDQNYFLILANVRCTPRCPKRP